MIGLMGKKKPVGRPKGDAESVLATCRLHPDVEAAISAIARQNRRSKSSEMEIAVESRVLLYESLLRQLELWTDALEGLKPKPPTLPEDATSK